MSTHASRTAMAFVVTATGGFRLDSFAILPLKILVPCEMEADRRDP